MRNLMYPGKDGKNFWIKRAIFLPIVFAAIIFIFGSVVMYLWNAILPTVLGIHTITFWQATGILLLSKILFGRFPHRQGYRGFHDHGKDMREKWMNLSPEEREKMKTELKKKMNSGWWDYRFENPTKQE
jgi:Ca2+/H+ antiporter, TMEM165/GDT1 family